MTLANRIVQSWLDCAALFSSSAVMIALPASILVVLVTACNPASQGSDDLNDEPLDPDVPPITEGTWARFSPDTTWQWQLQPNSAGRINTSYEADAYDADLFDVPDDVIAESHAAGRLVICYFSAGSFETFRDGPDHHCSCVAPASSR